MSARALVASVPLLLAGAGCLQISWSRESRYAPIPPQALAALATDAPTGLGECLATFGAPLWVWEHAENGRPGAVLAYGWFDEKNVGLSLSVPVSDYFSVSLDYDQVDQRMKGLVLFFDESWTLTHWRTGLLRDLTGEARRPPAALEEDA